MQPKKYKKKPRNIFLILFTLNEFNLKYIYIGRNHVFNFCDAFYQLGKDCLVLIALFYAFFNLKHIICIKLQTMGFSLLIIKR